MGSVGMAKRVKELDISYEVCAGSPSVVTLNISLIVFASFDP